MHACIVSAGTRKRRSPPPSFFSQESDRASRPARIPATSIIIPTGGGTSQFREELPMLNFVRAVLRRLVVFAVALLLAGGIRGGDAIRSTRGPRAVGRRQRSVPGRERRAERRA